MMRAGSRNHLVTLGARTLKVNNLIFVLGRKQEMSLSPAPEVQQRALVSYHFPSEYLCLETMLEPVTKTPVRTLQLIPSGEQLWD